MNGFVFDKGIDITPVQSPMGFTYGAGVFGPEVEIRRLEDIRASLRDPQCKGPEQVYSIAMDVGKEEHRALLNKLHLLFGVVTYSAGKLGQEPVRTSLKTVASSCVPKFRKNTIRLCAPSVRPISKLLMTIRYTN